ncbi:hypothetical protein CYLTODRAFT_460228 [Cylindrobasidium torrendii FP15055 ss-10]|uniref:Uncharacterized protein n=1 Tax=Cylindrobasidium torrendii FP15055 ss-10 TaxID=1314674 RepID=A0A0D7AT38_9AGAR|nr:hypothetical protein CYLTODRAFT_460228 [Cylindrobasidium torrendii FP15055 ss-10]
MPATGALPPHMPTTDSLVRDEFWSWWRWLQPEWRETPPATYPLTKEDRELAEDDWEGVDASGNNGIINVMAYLLFWGMRVVQTGAGRQEWIDALCDVEWVLSKMLEQ